MKTPPCVYTTKFVVRKMASLGIRQRDKYLVALALRRERMKRVCKSIKLHKQWCNQQIWTMEVAFSIILLSHKNATNALKPFHLRLIFLNMFVEFKH